MKYFTRVWYKNGYFKSPNSYFCTLWVFYHINWAHSFYLKKHQFIFVKFRLTFFCNFSDFIHIFTAKKNKFCTIKIFLEYSNYNYFLTLIPGDSTLIFVLKIKPRIWCSTFWLKGGINTFSPWSAVVRPLVHDPKKFADVYL